MYYISLTTNGIKKIVHWPSAKKEDPHLSNIHLEEELSLAESFSFDIYPYVDGYNDIEDLITRYEMIDTRNGKLRAGGRVLNTTEHMDSSGKIFKEVVCEGYLAYFNDTYERGSTYSGMNPTDLLNSILNNYNSKVDDSRKIYLGEVDMTGTMYHTCDYKTTLAELMTIRENYGGHFRVRNVNGTLYLDWKKEWHKDVLNVSLGENMKEMVKSRNLTNMGTRIIPLGANNLTIESVNGGKDYLDYQEGIQQYGIIEKPVNYTDIEDPAELKRQCELDFNKFVKIGYTLSTTAYDLSYLTGNTIEQFQIGTVLHIDNPYMKVNDIFVINKLSLDPQKPYNPTLEITNVDTSLSSTITDVKSETITNNGVYNNVQIGSDFGIRAVRSDQKAVTTINATEGISIHNNNEKVFYVDMDGRLVAVNVKAVGGDFENINVNTAAITDATITDATINNEVIMEDVDVELRVNNKGMYWGVEGVSTASLELLLKKDLPNHKSRQGLYAPYDLVVGDDLDVDGDLIVQGDIKMNGKWLDKTIEDKVYEILEFHKLV